MSIIQKNISIAKKNELFNRANSQNLRVSPRSGLIKNNT